MRAELGHLVCCSWNRGCPCRSEELLHSKGTATALGSCCCCHGPVLCTHQDGAPPRGGKGQRPQDSAHTEPCPTPGLCTAPPHAPAPVTNPCSARAGNRSQQCTEPDCWLQPLPKELPQAQQRSLPKGAHPWVLEETAGLPHSSPVSTSNTMAQQAAPMAAPCKTLGCKLPQHRTAMAQDCHGTGLPCSWQVSHATHSGTSSNTGVHDLGTQRKQPSEAAGPDSLESNSCSGKCPLPHNSLQGLGAPAFLFASCLNSQVPMFLQLQSSEIHKKIF